jgi:hypothetical protein
MLRACPMAPRPGPRPEPPMAQPGWVSKKGPMELLNGP